METHVGASAGVAAGGLGWPDVQQRHLTGGSDRNCTPIRRAGVFGCAAGVSAGVLGWPDAGRPEWLAAGPPEVHQQPRHWVGPVWLCLRAELCC